MSGAAKSSGGVKGSGGGGERRSGRAKIASNPSEFYIWSQPKPQVRIKSIFQSDEDFWSENDEKFSSKEFEFRHLSQPPSVQEIVISEDPMTTMIQNFTSDAAIPPKKCLSGGVKVDSLSQGEKKSKKAQSGGVKEPAAAPSSLDRLETEKEDVTMLPPAPPINPLLLSPPSLPVAVNRDMFLSVEDEDEGAVKNKIKEEVRAYHDEEWQAAKRSKKTSGASARSNDSKEGKPKKASKASGGGKSSGRSKEQPLPPSPSAQRNENGQIAVNERAPTAAIGKNAYASFYRPAFGIRGPKNFKPPSSTIIGQGEIHFSAPGHDHGHSGGLLTVGVENGGYKVPGLRKRHAPARNA